MICLRKASGFFLLHFVAASSVPTAAASNESCSQTGEDIDETGLLQVSRAASSAASSLTSAVNASGESETEEVPNKRPGSVYFLFTLGAAGAASPGLSDRKHDGGCFAGWRVWTSKRGRFATFVDFASWVTGIVGLRHTRMKQMEMTVDDPTQSRRLQCNSAETALPSSGVPSSSLHSSELYIELANAVKEPFWANLSIIAGRKSYMDDIPSVAQNVRQYGYCLVGTAFHEGHNVFGGPQVSHLFQRPDTMDCAITFQGSSFLQDWAANLRFSAAHFCGLVDEDETCSGLSECAVRHAGGSFVHRGFRDHLMALIRHTSWQENIRPYLSSCTRLAVSGHSLGGAVASLFAACINRAPKEGTYGYDDYKHMRFDVSTAKPLTCKE